MAGPTPMILKDTSQQGLLQFHNQCYTMFNQQWNLRENMRVVDLAYMREAELSEESERAKISNRAGNKDRFQNITIPVVMPQVEAAVTYQASVFLTGVPIFGVVADPQFMDEATQLETVIADQATRGGWTRELMLFFRDGFKYGGISAIEVPWVRETTVALDTNPQFSTSQAQPKEVIWEGNKIKRLDPYNIVFDTRVTPSQMHKKGEFFGYNELMSRVALKQFVASLPDAMVSNLKQAFESGMGAISYGGGNVGGIQSYYIPFVNPKTLLNTNRFLSTDWTAWAGISGSDRNTIQYKNMFEVTTIYARIIPADFDIRVPGFKTPQVWKLIFVNHQVLIYAERQTNAHGYIPVLMGQPLEDGLMYQTKSLAENASPIQDITSALSNSQIASRRRAISDRVIYDPSRITSSDINSANPSAKIPVRPAAFGKNVADAVYAFPFRDDQAPIISQEIGFYSSLADKISGQNPVRQGQFVKGNKTKSEFNDVMSHANGRDQMISLMYEDQVFTPLKEILKINILQFQGGTSLYSATKKQVVQVDPVALRKAVLNFKVSDGLTPTSKLISADTMQVALQVMGSSPTIAAEYNVAEFFSYLMKTQGAHISDFEKSPAQKSYEQAVQSWNQMAASVMELMKAVSIKIEGLQMSDVEAMVKKLIPPQPVPQQFGYQPANSGTNSGAASTPQQSAPASGE